MKPYLDCAMDVLGERSTAHGHTLLSGFARCFADYASNCYCYGPTCFFGVLSSFPTWQSRTTSPPLPPFQVELSGFRVSPLREMP